MMKIVGSLMFLMTTSLWAQPLEFSQIHQVTFKITQKLKIPPPQVAFVAAVANSTAYSVVESPLAYSAAFIEIYALVYPSERPWLDQILVGEDSAVVNRAKLLAQQKWTQIQPQFAVAAASLSKPWPLEGYAEGHWRPTPPAFAQPLYPNWNQLFTFSGLNLNTTLNQISPTDFKLGLYQTEMFEVHQLGSVNSQSRKPQHTEMAVFWAAGAGTITPPGMWLDATVKLLENQKASFKTSARVMMLLSQALSDAGVASWAAKYKHATCRPVTAIADFMGQKDWKPLLATPPFPAWVSGHSTFSSAAAMVLDSLRLIKDQGIKFQSEAVPGVVKSFPTAYQAALEAGMSRIYGGIHFQDDNTDGLLLGQQVGCAVMMKNGLQCQARSFSPNFPFR